MLMMLSSAFYLLLMKKCACLLTKFILLFLAPLHHCFPIIQVAFISFSCFVGNISIFWISVLCVLTGGKCVFSVCCLSFDNVMVQWNFVRYPSLPMYALWLLLFMFYYIFPLSQTLHTIFIIILVGILKHILQSQNLWLTP